MIVKGLRATLEPEPDMDVVGSAASGAEALRQFRETTPDVTIMDLTLGGEMSGIETTKAIRDESPDARIIMLTVHEEEDKIYRAMQAGAATYLLKETLGDCLVSMDPAGDAGGAPMAADIGRKYSEPDGQATADHPRIGSASVHS